MNLVFISDKVCWPDPTSPSGYSTVGGYPFQMQAISRLFDQTRLIIMERKPPVPPNLMPLVGHSLSVHPVLEPAGEGWRHLLAILGWLFSSFSTYWREIQEADALHIAVPGLGSVAILFGLLQRKKMFIRHCGTWNQPVTLSNHVLLWLLERIGSARNIVFATGGSDQPPSKTNPNITWIFSTTLTQAELDQTSSASPWTPGGPLRLVTVGRLADGKNVQSTIRALAQVKQTIPEARLDVLGDGEYRPALETLAAELGLSDSVAFHGNVNHEMVLKTLSRSHLFVFPTRVKEGFPKAVLEALACGLPVIATRVSVIPQLLQNGSGLLLDDTNAPAVANAILELTAQPARLAEMGRLARVAAQGYTLEAWGEAIGQRLCAAWGPLKEGEA